MLLTAVLGVTASVSASPAMATPIAMPNWVEAYTQEALAAPVTLDNALKYRWYQIGVGIRARHPMVYDIDHSRAAQTTGVAPNGIGIKSHLKP